VVLRKDVGIRKLCGLHINIMTRSNKKAPEADS
jgi:hypothetical protein